MLRITINGEIYKVLDLYIDTLVDLIVREKGKVQELKMLPFGPCDGIKVSRWRQPSLVLIPRGLMQIGGCVRYLDGFCSLLVISLPIHLAFHYLILCLENKMEDLLTFDTL